MKRFIYLIAVVSAFLFVTPTFAVQTWDGTSSEAWTNGLGTEADPYLIEMPAHLAYLSAQVAAGNTYEGVHFLQTDDFDLNSKTWTPIGTSTYMFSGVYDGGGKYISNLTTSIFGYTNDIVVSNVRIKGELLSFASDAPLIIETQGTTVLTNCHNLATISFQSSSLSGGIISVVNGTSLTMKNCINVGELIQNRCGIIGGLVGQLNTSGFIDDCHNRGAITQSGYSSPVSSGTIYKLGGIVGDISSSTTILRCSNQGNLLLAFGYGGYGGYIPAQYVGGIVGFTNNDVNYEGCYSKSDISSVTKTVATTPAGTYGTCCVYGIGMGTSLKGCYVIANLITGGKNNYSYPISKQGIESSYSITNGNEVYNHFSHVNNDYTKEHLKSVHILSILNMAENYFEMDLDGINDGYPILTWQKGTRYNINATCDPTRGTVKGGGEYAMGNTVTLTATPKYGSIFVGWSDGNTDNPRTITVEGDANYIAQFTKSAYTIYVNQDGTSYIE